VKERGEGRPERGERVEDVNVIINVGEGKREG